MALTMAQPTLTLRASCDACASSKVKCDKEQPACRRCIAAGTTCVYGISRKHGKQAHRRWVVADGNRAYSLAPKVGLTPGNNLDTTFEDFMQDMGLFGNVPTMASDDQNLSSLLTPQPTVTTDGWSSLMDPTSLHSINPQRLPLHGSKRCFDETMDMSANDGTRSMYEYRTRDESRSFLPTPESISSSHSQTNSFPNSHKSPPDPASHQCYNLASETVKALNLESRFGPSVKGLDGVEMATLPVLNLDHILEANKAALLTLQRVLDCPCSNHNAPLAFLNASIISKISSWYRVGSRIILSATGADVVVPQSASISCPRSSESPATQATNGPRPGSCAARLLSSLPISVGAFEMDLQDRAALSRHLLLSELRKTANLVERLQAKSTDTEDDELSGFHNITNTGSVASLYSMLGSWLNAEVARTIREVKKEGREDLATDGDRHWF